LNEQIERESQRVNRVSIEGKGENVEDELEYIENQLVFTATAPNNEKDLLEEVHNEHYNKVVNKTINPNRQVVTHHQLNIYCENKDPQLTIDSERESFIAFLRMLKESNLNEPIFNTAIDKVLHFIENVRKYRYQMFEVTTNAWMNEDWLIQSIQNHFTTTGSLLLPYAPLAIKHFPTLAQVNASSISYNVNSLFSYYDVISILSGVFISYAGSHYGVEPIHIIEDDIYWFNDALVNVCDKLYKLYFNN
jgi:hypothetical protein